MIVGLSQRGFIIGVVFLSAFILNGMVATAAWAQQELLVSAASSLTDAFKEVGKRFESANPGTKVIFNFAASGPLLQQIDKGAPVDVFASADQKTMDRAREKHLLFNETRKDFVSNGLVLVAPKDSKLTIKGVKDLADPKIARIALGNPETVPAGRYAQEALASVGLWEPLKAKFIYGESVRQVLDYAVRGEVDAGFVFSTDAASAKGRVLVAAASEGHQPIRYPVAVVAGTKKKELSLRFIDFLLGEEGRAVLLQYGFGKP